MTGPEAQLSDAQRKHLRNKRKATLTRKDYYRSEGCTFLKGGGEGRKAAVYNDDARIQDGLKFNKMTATHQPSDFYFEKYRSSRASVPYFNIAHHLISCTVFDQGGVFSDDELTILRAVKYDVNRGRNVIFLPGYSDGVEVQLMIAAKKIRNWDLLKQKSPKKAQDLKDAAYADAEERARKFANLHKLPCHWDYHEPYIDYVNGDMRSFKSLLCAAVVKDCDDWNPPDSILSELKNREDDYWKWVVGFGKRMKLGEAKSIGDITKPPNMPRGKGK
jgi:hypothetical protein